MLGYIEYLGVPASVGVGIVVLFFVTQLIGEILELRGKVVPEILKVRKFFSRRKEERKILHELPDMLNDCKSLMSKLDSHYTAENSEAKQKWINYVDTKLEQVDGLIKEFGEKLDKNNQDTLSLLIDNKRNAIIDFASVVVDDNAMVTREQFNRVFKLYNEYEAIITANNMTNGEVDIAFRIIRESYEQRLKAHNFIEDLRGYNVG